MTQPTWGPSESPDVVEIKNPHIPEWFEFTEEMKNNPVVRYFLENFEPIENVMLTQWEKAWDIGFPYSVEIWNTILSPVFFWTRWKTDFEIDVILWEINQNPISVSLTPDLESISINSFIRVIGLDFKTTLNNKDESSKNLWIFEGISMDASFFIPEEKREEFRKLISDWKEYQCALELLKDAQRLSDEARQIISRVCENPTLLELINVIKK